MTKHVDEVARAMFPSTFRGEYAASWRAMIDAYAKEAGLD